MSEIERLLARNLLQRVEPDRSSSDRLLSDAGLHLETADAARSGGDLAGAYQLAYDAARKALTALLLDRGLRTHGSGAHATLIAAISELYRDRRGGDVITKLDRMRSTRNQAEYVGRELSTSQVNRDLALARSIVTFVMEQRTT